MERGCRHRGDYNSSSCTFEHANNKTLEMLNYIKIFGKFIYLCGGSAAKI